MLVSRKYLALIHFFTAKVPSGADVSQPAHKGIESWAASGAGGVQLKPFPKCSIQSLTFGLSHKPRLLNQGFIGAQSNVFHTKLVYTILVHTATVLMASKG